MNIIQEQLMTGQTQKPTRNFEKEVVLKSLP